MSTLFEPTLGSLFGIPPAESALSDLARALLEVNRKPRSRSEWEARFSFWQKPASETEETQIAAAASRVRRAMRHSGTLPHRSWAIVEQGSYHNNTNTRTESDIDLCVCLTDAFFVEGPPGDWPTMAELGREPMPISFDQYRGHIAWCLQQEFGTGAVTLGNKAIHLHKHDVERINADIVPAYVFQRFGARLASSLVRSAPDVGVAFLTASGKLLRKTVTGRQTKHNLSYLGGITDLFPPIRFQGLGNGPDGRFIVRKQFRRVLISAGAPIRPHATGLKGAHLHAERRELLGKRFREASDSPFRCMVRRAAGPSQAAADR
jgi:hypothetical protein